MKDFVITFEDSEKKPVELKEDSLLSEHLNVQNSPILFGCRIGICGTCSIEILEGSEKLIPRTCEEIEYLEALAPDKPNCRLACQIRLNAHIKVKKVEI
ncbi:MAG: 2Fe-2S iron-sulfur cluster-binding protein [Bdellovibrionota bacterium]